MYVITLCLSLYCAYFGLPRGNFADGLGDDFLGLRELGIAAEFGLSSLTVPKKLLKGKNKGGIKDGAAAYVVVLSLS